jgi:NAD-dependent deacetylase
VPAFSLITQNVDGLHQRAGSADVIEFHGNLFVSRCSVEGCVVDAADTEDVPVCPRCGAPARPGVVWFGEAIPEDAMAASLAAAADCELFMSIGTSSQVFPAASLFDLARDKGAVTVEINPQPTDRAAQFDFALAGKSGVVVPKLLELLLDELQHDGPETR